MLESSGQQQTPSSATAQYSDAQPGTPQTSSSQTATQTETEKNQHEKAEEQLKEQEHQRVAGVMATFNTTSNHNALPLSPGQKFRLFFRSEIDPWPFLLASVVSGIGQADDSYPEWGQGVQGYAKRFGASYSDAFIGNFFGNAVLTSVLHEDPRYFQKGSGRKTSRFFWAASSTVWCKRDKGGWGPNYANIGGNLIGSAIARLVLPRFRTQCERHHYRRVDGFCRRDRWLRNYRVLARPCTPYEEETRREAGQTGGATRRPKCSPSRSPSYAGDKAPTIARQNRPNSRRVLQ